MVRTQEIQAAVIARLAPRSSKKKGAFRRPFESWWSGGESNSRPSHCEPIGLAGGLNTYAYVGGNPVSYVDPNGLGPLFAVVCAAADAGYQIYQIYQALTPPRVNELKAKMNELAEQKRECDVHDTAKIDALDGEIEKVGSELMQATLDHAKSNAAYTWSDAVEGLGWFGVCGLIFIAPTP